MTVPASSPAPPPTAPDRSRRRRALPLAAVVAALVGGVLLYLFQPWALLTTTTVDDAPPTAAAPPTAVGPATASPSEAAPSAAPSTAAAPSGPLTVASGQFRSYEHETVGTATLLRVGSGYVVRLTGFATSNGPDVKVWLTKAASSAAGGSRDAGYVSLGDLRGNRGNQNYPVPGGTSVGAYRTVVVWCDRFSVPFGAAPLAPA